jgi:hypothetical protein
MFATSDEPAYRCAECGDAFDSQQAYASHAGHTGHDVAGTSSPTVTPSMLSRAINAVRIGRDKDGDGDLDVSRAVLWGQRAIIGVGIVVGHTLAHDPTLAYQVVTYASAILFAGRGVAQIPQTPLPTEWFDSRALMHLGLGMLFGASLVLLPFDAVLDVLADAAGLGHAPGAHAH